MLKMEKTAKKRPRTREKKPLQLRNKQGILKKHGWGIVAPKPMFVVPLPTIFPRRGEEEVAGMTGKYAHNIDAKGRLFIPAKLREELGGKNFHLIIGQDMCLSLFSDESWNEKMAALKEQSYSSLKKLRMIFAHAADCDPDAQGRILIPADLRQKAGLNKEVIVVGSFDRVEIWDAQRWARMEEEAFSSGELQAAMEEMGL